MLVAVTDSLAKFSYINMLARSIRQISKSLLRQPIFAPLVAAMIVRSLEVVHEPKTGAGALSLLIFSRERWDQDIEALARIPDVRLVSLPTGILERINALFHDPHFSVKANNYYQVADKDNLRHRHRQVAYLTKVMALVRVWAKLDAAVTCSFKYVREAPWSTACDRAGLPFVALHKEFTVLEPRHLESRIAESQGMGFRFFGTHLCCVNENARQLFARAGVFPAEKITKVGLLRVDNLYQPKAASTGDGQRKSVVLFSFGHLTGPFPSHPVRNYYFAKDDNFGFVELFKSVHAGFAELARKHPDIDFLIKPKNVEPGWIGEIRAVIESELGCSLDDIPNCRIVGEPAPDLMRQSLANIVLNSTTVIESRIAGRNTIIPLFAEAAGRHMDMVYFREFLDLFAVATSREDMTEKIERAIKGEILEHGSQARLNQLLERQIGNCEGRSAERLTRTIRAVVAASVNTAAIKSRLPEARQA